MAKKKQISKYKNKICNVLANLILEKLVRIGITKVLIKNLQIRLINSFELRTKFCKGPINVFKH